MEFPIKVMVIVMICLIAFIMLAALMGVWGSNTNSLIEGLFRFFISLFGGGPGPGG